MSTDPKALYLNALEKTLLAAENLGNRSVSIVSLREAEFIQRQLSDALMSMNALIRLIKHEPPPPVGESVEGK